ncbi:uncharacterized protein LOC131623046 [Vicia villosa]|uniref:uncharacterized protein LOC131623046 n=1 Tax=Vicia villosa TaxID=3911 RepID=UPI00273B5C47|nr:uncharacterized protein LOC131623046 [Vicia villosa]
MGKKRKSTATSLDEVDRTMYASFCTTANSISQLYTHAMNHQKLSFHAGERNALEKLYQWIWKQEEGGSRVGTVDVVNYIQNELDYCGEEPSMSPRAPPQHQQPQPMMPVTSSGFPVTSGSSGQTLALQGFRADPCENQPVFSNALSSPVRRNLQLYQIGEGGISAGNGNQGRDSNSASSNNDSAMDMYAD